MPPDEDRGEKLDRELSELLQELRVLLPGVQVLFAFLLTVPFSSRFPDLKPAERGLYLGALVCAAVSSALLIAPSSFHRILFRERDKEWMIVTSNRLAIAGTVFLATAITAAAFLVTEFMYGARTAAAVTAALAALFIVVWYAIPLLRRTRN